jgi:hypothetical protein
MAENESLDLTSPSAMRWRPVLDAAVKGEPSKKVSSLAQKALLQSIRNTMDRLARSGLSISDFLAQRNSGRGLHKLVTRALHRPFAELMVSVLKANPNAPNTECSVTNNAGFVRPTFSVGRR